MVVIKEKVGSSVTLSRHMQKSGTSLLGDWDEVIVIAFPHSSNSLPEQICKVWHLQQRQMTDQGSSPGLQAGVTVSLACLTYMGARNKALLKRAISPQSDGWPATHQPQTNPISYPSCSCTTWGLHSKLINNWEEVGEGYRVRRTDPQTQRDRANQITSLASPLSLTASYCPTKTDRDAQSWWIWDLAP